MSRQNRRNSGRGRGCLFGFLFVILISLACAISFASLIKEGIIKDTKEISSITKEIKIPFQKVSIDENELTNKYYYQQLSDKEKRVYKEILQGVRDDSMDIYLHTADGERALSLYEFVLNDFPELFWCTGDSEINYSNGGIFQESYSELKPVYIYSGEERKLKMQEIENAVNVCIAGISADASEYERIKYVYEYIINTTEYNLEAPDNQNIYSVLVNKQSVCAGYARANQYILEKLGIFCTYVTGTATSQQGESQPHAWNIVKCDGEYYHVDTTWGDPVFTEESTVPNPGINYDYLCCTDNEIFITHTKDTIISFPECTSMNYNYYILNGLYYDYFDYNEALNTLYYSIDQGSPMTVFKYANGELYQQALDTIVNDLIDQAAQHLANEYGLSQVQYYYETNEQVERITLYWQYY